MIINLYWSVILTFLNTRQLLIDADFGSISFSQNFSNFVTTFRCVSLESNTGQLDGEIMCVCVRACSGHSVKISGIKSGIKKSLCYLNRA